MKNKKNKRGDVPVTILVLGVFAVCTLAMISFVNSDRNIDKSFIGLGFIEEANMEIEKNNLNHYYEEQIEKRIVPKLRGKWVEHRIIFSVEYNPRIVRNP